jgi:predicted SprT family Zn-dependent metalloprotease
MTSDDTTRNVPDVPFRPRGLGMAMLFRCGRCCSPSATLGRGMRHVAGLRTYVCKACKDEIDAKRVAP